MSYVTGISGNVISAASAGFAPTNSAEVSAIASAYATGGAQVVSSLQYATSQSATVSNTVTADTAIGYGARDISAEYYDYGYGPWTEYDSSTPLVKVRMTSDGDMRNYSSYPFYLYMVPYGATNYGNASNTSNLTGARDYGYFSGDMEDFIIAEGTGSAFSLNPSYVDVTFNVTHVPFVGEQPAYWGTDTDIPGKSAVDGNEDTRPVFCVAGGYDGSFLFELRSNVTAEMDFGSLVTVSSVSGINELGIDGGGIDEATVSAIASAYGDNAINFAQGTVYVVSNNSADWMKLSSFSGIDGMVTSVGSSTGWSKSASAFMGVDSAIKGTTGTIVGMPLNTYTAQLPDGLSTEVIVSAANIHTSDSVYIYYTRYNGSIYNDYLNSTDRTRVVLESATGVITATSLNRPFQIDFTAKHPEALAFQSDLTGAGGIDSATCSAIASAYAESAVSAVSGDYYSTSNPSGFIDSAYVDSAVSGKADESALSGYYTTANESGFLTAASSDGGVQVYATGTDTSTNQFSAANASAGASLIAGTKARVRLWDSDYTGNMYASSIQTWNNKLDGSAIQYVAGSADATANGVLYILTGNA